MGGNLSPLRVALSLEKEWEAVVSDELSILQYDILSYEGSLPISGLKAWFPYNRPCRLKKCSDYRDDHMETLPRRSQTTWIASEFTRSSG